jgi:hypothetical protein
MDTLKRLFLSMTEPVFPGMANSLTQRYGYHALMATAPTQGFSIEEEETLEDGTMRVVVARWV